VAEERLQEVGWQIERYGGTGGGRAGGRKVGGEGGIEGGRDI